ncbi:MAG: hypothetical protein OYI31_06610 [Chloroflexota bacterium]|nr:hypothetical protein [Chloroflexota bacterium]MDE2941474.1 hypothetical protein [Chloroflexota bacterium]MDE3268102.1 hypothetical protein [Chloroflexota bacterium]
MSRRRDRERYEAMRRLDPDYRGFRGHSSEPRAVVEPLEPVTCTVCGRTRNVPQSIASEQRDSFVCSRCQETGRQEPEGAAAEAQAE